MSNNKKIASKALTIALGATMFGGISGVVFNAVADTQQNSNNGNVISRVESYIEYENFKNNSTSENLDHKDDSNEESATIDPAFSIPTTTVDSNTTNPSQNLDVSAIAEGVMPAIVSVNVKATEEYYNYFGMNQKYEVEGCGSGIIIGEAEDYLYVITNNHVIENATEVSVAFIDGTSCNAKVKNTDEDNDLAVIVIRKKDMKKDTIGKIAIAKLGNSDAIKVGEQVVAIGNALGYGQSVTTGIVSAMNCVNSTNATPLIQTDAAINPGNSGGALINMRGEIIGINSSKYADTKVEGMGFAIPISSVQNIISDLITLDPRDKYSEEDRGYLGVSCGTVTEESSYLYGMPQGVMITDFQQNSAAKKAGLKKNDIITKVNGKSVKTADSLIDKLGYYAAGEKVTITYQTLENDTYVEHEVDIVLGRK